ncbi:hypothetical protein E2C01_102832 [Portunus trituberculatus]|uniref:Uncharacterized protein n=1 Tax=Portunus trituberculatus TaxID=210409 RepID=A0A5B7K986_PORTR|nr:hypothetical protein [Portunus trituberculatus]
MYSGTGQRASQPESQAANSFAHLLANHTARDLNQRQREELRGTISHANHLVIEDALAYPVFLATPARVIDWSRRIK